MDYMVNEVRDRLRKVLGDRLRTARVRAGLRQVELAAAMGDRYDQTMISSVERGRSGLKVDGLVKACQALGVSVDYLLGLLDDPTPAAELSELAQGAKVAVVAMPQVAVSAGCGMMNYDETVISMVPFPPGVLMELGVRAENCNLLIVRGDSMEPTISDGSTILVDRSAFELRDRRIYVMRTEDGVVVKRVVRHGNFGWVLMSDNPIWSPMPLADGASVVGQVRWSSKKFPS